MGPISLRLKYSGLSYNEDLDQIEMSQDGTPLEFWATSCPDMPRITAAVAMKVFSGSFNLADEEDSEGSSYGEDSTTNAQKV